MSLQDGGDKSSVNSGAINRRNILLAGTTVAVAWALGPVLMQTRAQAQAAEGGLKHRSPNRKHMPSELMRIFIFIR